MPIDPNFHFERFVFDRQPEACSLQEYQAVIQKARDLFARLPGILAIYQYGNVTVPGISDVDLLLVFADDAPALKDHWGQYCGEKEKYLLMHAPAVLPVSLFEHVQWVTNLQGGKLLWGLDFPQPGLPEQAKPFVSPLVAAEHSIRILVSLFRQITMRVVRQRPALCEISSIRYDLSEFPDLEVTWRQPFSESVADLRKSWFDLPISERQNRLFELYKTAYQVEVQLVTKASEWAQSFYTRLPSQSHRRISTIWSGVFLKTADRNFGITGSSKFLNGWIRFALPMLPLRFRSYALRWAKTEIVLGAELTALLLGQTEHLLPEYQAMLVTRQKYLLANERFVQRIGGGLGNLHVPPMYPSMIEACK